MERNTVLLDVEKYNELRDFKKDVENNWTNSTSVVIEETYGSSNFPFPYSRTRLYYTDSEIILDFEKQNKELMAKISELEAKISEFENKPVENISINDIMKMSLCEFRKWRKSYINNKYGHS